MSMPSESSTGIPVVLLSGAGLPAWIWDEVRADLSTVTDTMVATYPRGDSTSLADYAEAVATQVPWPTFAVVAHSIGGVVAAELLSHQPSRVVGVLGVSAVIPAPGQSFVRAMPAPARYVLGTVMRLAGTKPPEKVIRSGLARGLPETVADRLVSDFDPESIRLYRDAASPYGVPAARGYLHTTADKELGAAVQRRSAETLQALWTEEVPTAHLPMLQDPARVSAAVRRLLVEAAAHRTG